jgi:hypothetical protein
MNRFSPPVVGPRAKKGYGPFLWAGVAFFAALGTPSVRVTAQPTHPIYLQYDGYVRNKDGTLTLSFGYFNMNTVDVAVPPGDANSFKPAPADRNQPVTFLKGRHRFACSMVVDKTFDGTLQWTVAFAGKTVTTTPKALDPLYELELNSQKRAIAGLDITAAPKNVCVNRTPTVTIVNPFGEVNTDAAPAAAHMSARLDQEAAINGVVEDDGLPRSGKLAVSWKKNSGPGEVTFSDAAAGLTRARFSAAGTYELELTATDGERSNSAKVIVAVADPPK